MNIKLKIKKKYIGILATGISLYLLFFYLQEIYIWVTHNNNFELFLLVMFLVSTPYAILYWLDLGRKDKLANKIAREVMGDGNLTEQGNIKNHLYNKSYEEFYTLNLYKGKVKFTSSWPEQSEFEKQNM